MANKFNEHQQQFSALFVQAKLPHAVLLQGLTGTGKQLFAQWITQLLHCQSPVQDSNTKVYNACQQCKHCLLYQQKTHPDHQEIYNNQNNISVDEIRHINYFLENKAQLGLNKTVVIANAEKMTTSAANALLKTLEEPNANSSIFLLTTDITALLPTVISRCRVLTFNSSVQHYLEESQEQNTDDLFINMSQLAELNDENIAQEYLEFCYNLFNYLRKRQGLNQLALQLSDNVHGYRWFEKVVTNLLRFQAGWKINEQFLTAEYRTWLSQIEQEKLWKIYQLLLKTNQQIKQLQQVNKHFISEKFLINCANIVQKNEFN